MLYGHRMLVLPSFALGSLMLVALVGSSSIAAPPQLDYFFPAAVQRGQAVTVTAAGTFETWPVKTWVNRPGLEVKATEEKGKLKMSVADNARGGLYLVRLYDATGATAVKPVLVGELPQVLEKEPNNKVTDAQPLTESSTVNGKLEKGGDVDQYSIRLKKADRLIVAVQANRVLAAPMDAIVQITDARGFILVQNDDGRLLDPMVVFTAPADGTYMVRVFAFPVVPNSTIGFAGAANFVYRLTMTTGPFLEHAFADLGAEGKSPVVHLGGWNFDEVDSPIALADVSIVDPASPGVLLVTRPPAENFLSLPDTSATALLAREESSRQQPQKIPVPALIGGRIESPGDEDVFRFEGKKGVPVEFVVTSRALGYSMDPLLQVLDTTGKVLKEVDDTGKQRDCQLSFTPPEDGVFDLLVRDLHQLGGKRFVYRVEAQLQEKDFQLKLRRGTLLFQSKGNLEVPLDITRLHGFDGEISITAEGLPEGVTAKTVRSLAKKTSATKVKLVISGESKAFSGPIKIVGTTADGKKTQLAHYLVPGISWHRTDPWLTVLAK